MKRSATPQVLAPQDAHKRYAQKQDASLGVQVNSRKINQVGSVAERGQLSSFGSIFPETITASYNNSTASPVTVLFFDPEGLVDDVLSGTFVYPTWGSGVSNSVLKKFFATSPAVMAGFNYRITTGTQAQFSKTVKYHKVQIDGASQTYPVNIAQNIRNTQQSQTTQTMDAKFAIDQLSALSVEVMPNTAIAIDFFFEEIMNSLV